jgi:hypothetical protein
LRKIEEIFFEMILSRYFDDVVLLHFLFAILYFFSPFICLILMVECYNIFAVLKKLIDVIVRD